MVMMMTNSFAVFFTEKSELACSPYLAKTIAVEHIVERKCYFTADCIERGYAAITLHPNMLIFYIANICLFQSFLPAVSPMEEFEIALGADAAVKVEYKPVRKFQQTSGILSKLKVYNYHHVIEVKNTKSDSINVIVTDQLPRSCNDKIKVGMLYSILSLH